MNPDWHKDAACRGLAVNLFFPEPGDHHTVRTAMFYCNGGPYDVENKNGKVVGRDFMPACPVREDCLEFALRFPSDQDSHGIFGGQSPNQRNRIRIERRLAGEGVTIRYGVSKRGRVPSPD